MPFARLAPALIAALALAGLASLLDHGPSLGLSPEALDCIGRSYFAVLIGAPLVVYPLAFRRGEAAGVRVVLALLPGFLWWLTEIGLRLRGHALAEALWLAFSPINQMHLYLLLLATALADLGCRVAGWLRGLSGVWPGRGRVVGVVLALVVGPLLIGATIFPYVRGYHAFFQSGLLPEPEALPGPLAKGAAVRSRPVARPPNIVVILSDDHRFDFAGHAGHAFVETPALDRMAAEGVEMTRAYVTSSLCSPSRASFLTGTRPDRHGVWNNFTPWSNDNRTFLEYLAQAGYRTAFIGKWHMPGGLPDLRGVDHFVTFTEMGGQGVYEDCPLVVDGENEPSRKRYIAEELTDRSLEWIEADPGSPFALVLSHKNVHADFRPDPRERGRYEDQPVRFPPGAHPWTHLTSAQYVHVNPDRLDVSIRRYAEAVASMDREIGRLLDRLDDLGVADDTLVVYTSDNGYLWGEHGLVDKRWAYEESIRVPLIVRHPESTGPGGGRVDRLVTNVDLAPTLLDLAGLAVPDHMQGASWLPLLSDSAAPWRDALLYAYYFEPPYPTPTQHAVVTDRYKYIEYDGFPAELFDLENDPREARDLSNDPGSGRLRADLAERLDSMRRAADG